MYTPFITFWPCILYNLSRAQSTLRSLRLRGVLCASRDGIVASLLSVQQCTGHGLALRSLLQLAVCGVLIGVRVASSIFIIAAARKATTKGVVAAVMHSAAATTCELSGSAVAVVLGAMGLLGAGSADA